MQRQHKYRYFYGGKMVEVGQIDFFENGTYRVNDELIGGVLLEWTGLHDKNGKEIYEGDIVKGDGNECGVVEWGRAAWSVRLKYWKETLNSHAYPYQTDDRARFGVIGNIYENPELLKS